jgi:hypothetical protein
MPTITAAADRPVRRNVFAAIGLVAGAPPAERDRDGDDPQPDCGVCRQDLS